MCLQDVLVASEERGEESNIKRQIDENILNHFYFHQSRKSFDTHSNTTIMIPPPGPSLNTLGKKPL